MAHLYYIRNDNIVAYKYDNNEIKECSEELFAGKKAEESVTSKKGMSIGNADKNNLPKPDNDDGDGIGETKELSKSEAAFKKAIEFAENNNPSPKLTDIEGLKHLNNYYFFLLQVY